MPMKQWTVEVDGHTIRVDNFWTGGTRLYIDGECRDRNSGLFAWSRTLWLSAPLRPGDRDSGLVEVYVRARLTVQAQICVAGRAVAGDAL